MRAKILSEVKRHVKNKAAEIQHDERDLKRERKEKQETFVRGVNGQRVSAAATSKSPLTAVVVPLRNNQEGKKSKGRRKNFLEKKGKRSRKGMKSEDERRKDQGHERDRATHIGMMGGGRI